MIANENGGVPKHGKIHRVPLQHLSTDRLYGWNLFTAPDLVRELSLAIEIYYKNDKDHNKGILKTLSRLRRLFTNTKLL